MNNFLRETKKFHNISDQICIILGNESCDLDSAVCSLSLAYFYNEQRERMPSSCFKIHKVLPMLNISRQEFPLKTEVQYFLKANKIDFDAITFRDEVNEDFIIRNKLILVDHHYSKFAKSVVAIFDHRPFDVSSNLPEKCEKTLEQVGSCSTLIGNLFLQLRNTEKYKEPLKLLYGAVVLDTVNFSKKADRARELDYKVTEKIEKILGIANPEEERKIIFNSLVEARSDISTLSPYQILFKDMKIISNPSESIRIALPGFPILVQDFIHLENAKEYLEKFIDEHCSIVVLVGMKVTGDNVQRDLGLIYISESVTDNFELIKNNLIAEEHSLQLKEIANDNFLSGKFYQQQNIKASRKQILPIVKNVLANL